MKVQIDQQKCNGAGICVQELSQLFRFQEGSKKAVEKTRDVPGDLEKTLLKTASKCPTGAIIVLVK